MENNSGKFTSEDSLNEHINNQVKEYINNKRTNHQVVNKDEFMTTMKNTSPPEAWENQQKAYDDAWENNKNYQPDPDE